MDHEKEWNRKQTIELLQALQNHSCIWDMSSDDHKNKTKKVESYLELAQMFECTKEDIERKVAALRAGYRRELKKEMAAKAAGLDEYKTRWLFYKYMGFLHPDNCRSNVKRSLDGVEDDSFETSQIIDYEIQNSEEEDRLLTPPCSDKTKRKKKKLDSESVSILDQQIYNDTTSLLKVIRDASLQRTHESNSYKDECEVFGLSIASQLRNLKSNYAKSSAKLNIQKALFEAEQLDSNLSGPSAYSLAHLNNPLSACPPAFVSTNTVTGSSVSSKTAPAFITTNINSVIGNRTPSSDLSVSTTMPVLNKKSGPIVINPANTLSPGNEYPQAKHFLICTKTKNVM